MPQRTPLSVSKGKILEFGSTVIFWLELHWAPERGLWMLKGNMAMRLQLQ
jgi:hypothetical protein